MTTRKRCSQEYSKRAPLKVALIDNESLALNRLSDALAQMGHDVAAYVPPEYSIQEGAVRHTALFLVCPDVILADVVAIGQDRLDRLDELFREGGRCWNIGLMTEQGMSEYDLMRVAKFDTRVFLKPVEVSEVSAWLRVVAARANPGKCVSQAG